MVFHYQSVQYLEHLGSLYCTTPNLEDCTTASTSTVEVVNDGRRDYLWFQSKDGRFHDKWHWLSLDKITANKETATQRHLLKISLCQDNIHNKRNHTKKNNNNHHTFVTFQFSSRSDLESAKIYLKQYRNEARLAVDDDPIIDKPKEKTKDTTGGTSPTATNSSAGATSVTWVDESRPGHSLASLVATAMARDPSPAHTASTVSPSQSLTPLTSTSFSTYAVGSSSSHPTAAPPSQPRHFFPNHASTPVIVPDDGDEEFEDETTNHDEVPVCTLQGKVDNKKSKQEYKNQPQYPNKCNNLANTNDLQRPDDMKNVTKCDTPPSSLTVQEECELQRLIHQALEERLQQLGMDKDGTNENTRRRQSSRSCCDQCLSNIYAYLHTPIMTIISWIPSVSLVDRFSLPTALCVALLILTCKIAFVILFTFFMTTAQCTPTRTMIPADAPSLLSSSSTPLLYSSIYSPSHNQYLCSTVRTKFVLFCIPKLAPTYFVSLLLLELTPLFSCSWFYYGQYSIPAPMAVGRTGKGVLWKE